MMTDQILGYVVVVLVGYVCGYFAGMFVMLRHARTDLRQRTLERDEARAYVEALTRSRKAKDRCDIN